LEDGVLQESSGERTVEKTVEKTVERTVEKTVEKKLEELGGKLLELTRREKQQN
jgi:hypothetical protein